MRNKASFQEFDVALIKNIKYSDFIEFILIFVLTVKGLLQKSYFEIVTL